MLSPQQQPCAVSIWKAALPSPEHTVPTLAFEMWGTVVADYLRVAVHQNSISTTPVSSVVLVTKAGPCPFFRLPNQAASYRIAVHVFELLDMLLLSEDIEVIVSCLPKWRRAIRYVKLLGSR